MPRDPDALKIEKWAADGDVQTPEDRGLTRSVGWPSDFSQPGGRTPAREVFNQLFREATGMLVEINKHGLLEWNSGIAYEHPAIVTGSDGKVYFSLSDSTGVDPTTDLNHATWTPDIVDLADDDEADDDANETHAMTPHQVHRVIDSKLTGKITISSDAPSDSDGEDGDIWLEYEEL